MRAVIPRMPHYRVSSSPHLTTQNSSTHPSRVVAWVSCNKSPKHDIFDPYGMSNHTNHTPHHSGLAVEDRSLHWCLRRSVLFFCVSGPAGRTSHHAGPTPGHPHLIAGAFPPEHPDSIPSILKLDGSVVPRVFDSTRSGRGYRVRAPALILRCAPPMPPSYMASITI